MEKQKIVISLLIISIIFISMVFISAMEVKFFYSDRCPHCSKIKPLVNQLKNIFTEDEFNYYETSTKENQELFKSYNFTRVPSFVFIDGNNKVTFSGANEKRLICETQRMTTKDCPTYSADHSISGSWFIK